MERGSPADTSSPRFTKDRSKPQLLWIHNQHALVAIARDEFQTDNRDPPINLIGWHTILRAIDYRLNFRREKGLKYTVNLLDYLNFAAMAQLIRNECCDILGITRERASVMCDVVSNLIRRTGRRGSLAETESAKAGREIAQLKEKGGI